MLIEVDYLYVCCEYYYVTYIANDNDNKYGNYVYVFKNGRTHYFVYDCEWEGVENSPNSAYHKNLESVIKFAFEHNYALKFTKSCCEKNTKA